MKHKFSKIEIRIKKIHDKSAGDTSFYCIYTHVDDDVKIIGKSSIKPNIIKYNARMD